MLVSTFGTYVSHLNTIGHPIFATNIHFTTYYPPRDRQRAICQVQFLTLSNTFQKRVHHFICHFVSSNGDSQVILVGTLGTDVTELNTTGHPTIATHTYIAPPTTHLGSVRGLSIRYNFTSF